MSRPVSKARQFRLPVASSLIVMLLAACGGGGGSTSQTNPAGTAAQPGPAGVTAQTAVRISGYVVEGPVAGASVALYQRKGNVQAMLARTVTDTNGFFSIANPIPAGTGLMLEATGGSYTDDTSRQVVPLTLPLRAVALSTGGPARISITPYSEAAVRMIERLPQIDWSNAAITAANKRVADMLDVTDLLDFVPVDLHSGTGIGSARPNDLNLSLYTSGFGAYARRIDAAPASALHSAIEGVRRMASGEAHDDLAMPAFVGGMVDFLDVSAATSLDKTAMKTSLLTASSVAPAWPLSDEQLRALMPSGESSGGASAFMPNDAFQLVGSTLHGALFNYRGALVGYPVPGGDMWRMPYTASVADVYGDGDVGFGRWNGGSTVDATRKGGDLTPVTQALPLSKGGWLYALARPVSNVPVCGMRRLAPAGRSQPSVSSDYANAAAVAAGLTSDSRVVFWFDGKIKLGLDIGIVAPDGSVTRYTSQGGATNPAASQFQIDPQFPNSIDAELLPARVGVGGWGLTVKGLASGSGATKFVAKLALGPSQARTEFAVAFAAPGGVASDGCADTGAN